MSKGSVTATFTVYSDFLTYSSGVYQHLTGSQVGGHAVKMIGWGVTTGGVAYWICANQWVTDHYSICSIDIVRLFHDDNH